jgi:hypothetical protein
MHFANRRRHLLDGTDFFDHEPMRQKTLIDKLYDGLVVRLKPDCSKMLAGDIHTMSLSSWDLFRKSKQPEGRLSPRFARLCMSIEPGRARPAKSRFAKVHCSRSRQAGSRLAE